MAQRTWRPKEKTLFDEKAYKEGLLKLVTQTSVLAEDLDEKAIQFLDYLEEHGGHGNDACRDLLQKVNGRSRQQVTNWTAYVYTLLRNYDKLAYKEYKNMKRGRSLRKDPKMYSSPAAAEFQFSVEAAAFVPGKVLNADAPEFVPTLISLASHIPEAVQDSGFTGTAKADAAETSTVDDISWTRACSSESGSHESNAKDEESKPSLQPPSISKDLKEEEQPKMVVRPLTSSGDAKQWPTAPANLQDEKTRPPTQPPSISNEQPKMVVPPRTSSGEAKQWLPASPQIAPPSNTRRLRALQPITPEESLKQIGGPRVVDKANSVERAKMVDEAKLNQASLGQHLFRVALSSSA